MIVIMLLLQLGSCFDKCVVIRLENLFRTVNNFVDKLSA